MTFPAAPDGPGRPPPVRPPEFPPWVAPSGPGPYAGQQPGPGSYGPQQPGPGPWGGPAGSVPIHPVVTPPARRRPVDVQRVVAGWVLVGFGIAVGHSALTGAYTDYVRVGMKLPLLGAAIVLLVTGLAGVVSGISSPAGATGAHLGHEHGGQRRPVSTAVLLALVPLAVLVLFRPAALDAAATERVAPAAQPDTSIPLEVEPLPGRPDVPLPMSFYELFLRINSPGGPESLRGRQLVLQGFVAKNQAGLAAGQVRVGRYKIWCCAADGTFASAEVNWPAQAARPAVGQWFAMTVTVDRVRTEDRFAIPIGQATSVEEIQPPEPQYES